MVAGPAQRVPLSIQPFRTRRCAFTCENQPAATFQPRRHLSSTDQYPSNVLPTTTTTDQSQCSRSREQDVPSQHLPLVATRRSSISAGLCLHRRAKAVVPDPVPHPIAAAKTKTRPRRRCLREEATSALPGVVTADPDRRSGLGPVCHFLCRSCWRMHFARGLSATVQSIWKSLDSHRHLSQPILRKAFATLLRQTSEKYRTRSVTSARDSAHFARPV